MTIREQDPLKQGLKHFGGYYDKNVKSIREQDPLKQGLKHGFIFPCSLWINAFVSKIH